MSDQAPDALSLLRRGIATANLPIPTTSEDPSTQAQSHASLAQASYLIFNVPAFNAGPQSNGDAQHLAIPLSQPTRFISPASGDKPLDLRSIYFCWLNKDTSVGDYVAATQKLNDELREAGRSDVVTNLVFVEKLDLVTWLSGDVGEQESEFIKSFGGDGKQDTILPAAEQNGDGDVEMMDAGARLKEIYAGERKMGDRNTMLRGTKVQDFSDVRAKYSMLFFAKSRPPAQQQSAGSPPLTNNPALRPPVKAAQPGRRPEPIILLSPSASSLLRMPNIKSFLSDGVYTPPESGSAANILHLMRPLPLISGSKAIRFILVDDPSSFRPDYWDRLVAVFTTGQTWQFKNYKWSAPAELFSHALGVYVGWKGEQIPDTVKGWGRGVLSVQIDKGSQRWRDREVVEDVWRGIEGRMRAMGWGRDSR
nr:cell division control protein 73 [Quercus suber]